MYFQQVAKMQAKAASEAKTATHEPSPQYLEDEELEKIVEAPDKKKMQSCKKYKNQKRHNAR
jgi:hypothetical protein